MSESGAIGENLTGDLVGDRVKIALGFLRQKDLKGHVVRAFFLPRFRL